MLRSLLICVVASGPVAASSECEPAAMLAGQWQTEANQKGVYWQEKWSRLDANNWHGFGRTFNSSHTETAREELRLLRMNGQWFYLAKVRHNALPVAFTLTQCTASRLQFDNPAHDFPKRLVYHYQQDGLQVEVSDAAGKGFELQFKRAGNQ
ncbi:MAG: DUF6265 family protein [Rheinheimera sp.]|nr:DUF6265 family protein [Rheinheimera sp.]